MLLCSMDRIQRERIILYVQLIWIEVVRTVDYVRYSLPHLESCLVDVGV
jgi:hypothetical protein